MEWDKNLNTTVHQVYDRKKENDRQEWFEKEERQRKKDHQDVIKELEKY